MLSLPMSSRGSDSPVARCLKQCVEGAARTKVSDRVLARAEHTRGRGSQPSRHRGWLVAAVGLAVVLMHVLWGGGLGWRMGMPRHERVVIGGVRVYVGNPELAGVDYACKENRLQTGGACVIGCRRRFKAGHVEGALEVRRYRLIVCPTPARQWVTHMSLSLSRAHAGGAPMPTCAQPVPRRAPRRLCGGVDQRRGHACDTQGASDRTTGGQIRLVSMMCCAWPIDRG